MWHMFLYCVIGVQIIISAVINYFQFTLCRPLPANWGEQVAGAACVDSSTARTSMFVSLAMVMFTDLTFALLPLSLLRDRPPLHERVAICLIVFSGFLTTVATVARTTFVNRFVYSGKSAGFISSSPHLSAIFCLASLTLSRRVTCQRSWVDDLYEP
jgi:hypothetical protein